MEVPTSTAGLTSLPLELVERIAKFLDIRDAKSLGTTSWRFHCATLQAIWSKARFFHLPLVADVSHLPIKRMYSSDICDSFDFNPTDLPTTCRVYYIDEVIEDINEVARFQHYPNIHLIIFTDILLKSRYSIFTFYQLTQQLMCSVSLTTGRYSDENNPISPNLTLPELIRMKDFQFYKLNSDQLQYIVARKKQQFLQWLSGTNIQEIHFTRFQRNCVGLKFSREDIITMKELNIITISSRVLEGTKSARTCDENPWPELKHIKSLKTIHLASYSVLNLYNLSKFPFYGIKFGMEILVVNDITTLRELLDDRNWACWIISEGPAWIYRLLVPVQIFLK